MLTEIRVRPTPAEGEGFEGDFEVVDRNHRLLDDKPTVEEVILSALLFAEMHGVDRITLDVTEWEGWG